jgi:hypothetical protein
MRTGLALLAFMVAFSLWGIIAVCWGPVVVADGLFAAVDEMFDSRVNTILTFSYGLFGVLFFSLGVVAGRKSRS